MTVIIEKNALYSESDYIISLTLASWLRSFLCFPMALLFSYIRHRVYNSQLCSLNPGSQLSIDHVKLSQSAKCTRSIFYHCNWYKFCKFNLPFTTSFQC